MRRSISAESRVACDDSSNVSRPARARDTAEQQPGGAAGGAVVGADRRLAHRVRRRRRTASPRARPQRTSSLIAQLDRRQVGRQQGDALAVVDLRQFGGEAAGSDASMRCVTSVMWPCRKSPAACAICRSTRSRKGDSSAGSTKAKRKFSPRRGRPAAAARPARRPPAMHPLHRLGVDARAPVQDPVDRGRADAGDARDLGDGGGGGHRRDRCSDAIIVSTSEIKSIRVLEHLPVAAKQDPRREQAADGARGVFPWEYGCRLACRSGHASPGRERRHADGRADAPRGDPASATAASCSRKPTATPSFRLSKVARSIHAIYEKP